MKDLKQIQEFFSKPLEENQYPSSQYEWDANHPYSFTIYMDDGDKHHTDFYDLKSAKQLKKILKDKGEVYKIMKSPDGQFNDEVYSLEEMDINDPIMIRMRAAKDAIKNKKPDFGKEYGDAVKKARSGNNNDTKLRFLKKEREQLMRDMEQEAEPEGGPIADEYGSKLNRIDAAIAKLSGRKEMTYDQAIAEDNSYASSFGGFKKELDGETIKNDLQAKGYETPRTGIWNKILVKKNGERVAMIDTNESSYTKDGQTYKWRGMSNFINHVEPINENKSYARISMPRFVFDKNNPNFLNVYIDYDLGAGGASIALGKETMTGQIRRESSAEALKLAYEVAKDLEAEYDVEDIDVQDLENGKVRIFAVSDDFGKMNPNFGEETDYERRRKETNDYINESLNPEVTKALDRFIKAMAKRYDYSEKDAVFAIQAALRQRKMDKEDDSERSSKFKKHGEMSGFDMRGIDEATRQDLGMSSSVTKSRAKAELKNPGNDGSKVYGLDKDGKRVHIKSINDVDKFKKFELDADLNEDRKYNQEELLKLDLIAHRKFDCDYKKCTDEQKAEVLNDKAKVGVAEKVISQLKEEKPGLWANIRAKKSRGEKPSHGNSKAHKSAVKSGKKINKLKEEIEDNGPEEKSFDAELMAAANGIAATLGKELKAKQGDKEQLDEAVVTSIIAAVLTGNALIGFISKMSKKLAKKFNWKKGEDFAGKINSWAHDNEKAFQTPIKRVLKFFIKDEDKLETTTKAIYAVVIMGMAAGYGAEAVSSLSKASWFQASVASLKTIAKGDEALATAYPVIKSFVA